MKAVFVLFSLIAALFATGAWAGAGLLVNPWFDDADQLDGWLVNAGRVADWDPLDEDGLSSSGSARLTHDIDGNNGVLAILRQCVLVQPYQAYYFGASMLMPSGQDPEAGRGRVVVRTYASTDCLGESSLEFSPPLDPVLGEWQFTEGLVSTAPDTRSMRVRLSIQKFSGVTDDLTVHFDNVFLMSDQLFGDSFESG